MSKSIKEKIFDECLGDLKGLSSMQKKAIKIATLKAMNRYATARVKTWRNKVLELIRQIRELKSWE